MNEERREWRRKNKKRERLRIESGEDRIKKYEEGKNKK